MTTSRHINTPRRKWTPAQLDTLRAQYPHRKTADIATELGFPLELVYRRAQLLGLRKSSDFAASDKRGRTFKGGKLGQASQWQPGNTPWNAGKHYLAGGRSAETRFKPGERRGAAAHNYQPIGTVRLTCDGLLERKVTDNPALYPARRWVGVHRLVWAQAHGPVPPGHIIVFKPGQRTTVLNEITPDRLECITRAQLAARNHPNSRNPELARLIQLKGCITRHVNRITREAAAATS